MESWNHTTKTRGRSLSLKPGDVVPELRYAEQGAQLVSIPWPSAYGADRSRAREARAHDPSPIPDCTCTSRRLWKCACGACPVWTTCPVLGGCCCDVAPPLAPPLRPPCCGPIDTHSPNERSSRSTIQNKRLRREPRRHRQPPTRIELGLLPRAQLSGPREHPKGTARHPRGRVEQ